MWICQRCQTENRDSVRMCPVCGTARAAGRLGSVPQQRTGMASAPRVTAAQPAQSQEPSQPSPVRSGYQPPEENVRPPRRKGGGFARLVGALLCVLLPVMTLLLAWQQRELLRPVLAPLITGAEAPEEGTADRIEIQVETIMDRRVEWARVRVIRAGEADGGTEEAD